MSWVTVVWSMIAAACLTLAAVHFLVWWRRRRVWDDLLFTLSSTAVAIYAGLELSMMLGQTPSQFATALRWIHVPTWVIVVSLVVFVRLRSAIVRSWVPISVSNSAPASALLRSAPQSFGRRWRCGSPP
jgi:two-component system sensor kinase FixL